MLSKLWQNAFFIQSQRDDPIKENDKNLNLPGDLAGTILDLQIQCQSENVTEKLINELIAYYTDAIQFYETFNNQKYKIYQKRMHNFLSKPAITLILKGKSCNLMLKKQKVEKQTKQAIVNQKDEAIRIIQKSQKRLNRANKIIDKQIEEQNKNLNARIERRKSMSNKSSKSQNDDFQNDFTFDLNQSQNSNFFLRDLKCKNIKRVFI